MDKRSPTGLMFQNTFSKMFGSEDISNEVSIHGLDIADYMFENRSVIAEQKDIFDISKEKQIEVYPNLQKLHEKYGTEDQNFINFSAWSDEERADYKRFWQNKTTFVQHLVSKADKQIRDTKLRYKAHGARGLLILVNTDRNVHYIDLAYRSYDLLHSKTREGNFRYKNINSILSLNQNSSKPETMTIITERILSDGQTPNDFEYRLVDYIERNRINRRGFQSGPTPFNRPWSDVQRPRIISNL